MYEKEQMQVHWRSAAVVSPTWKPGDFAVIFARCALRDRRGARRAIRYEISPPVTRLSAKPVARRDPR